jgi:hypothetical protein
LFPSKIARQEFAGGTLQTDTATLTGLLDALPAAD